MTIAPHAGIAFSDAYPKEFVEWSDMLCHGDMTPQQRCAWAIIGDLDVMHAAKQVIPEILADNGGQWGGEDRLTRLNAVWTFIESASRLPDEQPAGSHLRRPEELPVFSTPSELRRDMSEAASAALELAELLNRIAPTLADTMPIAESCRLIDSLDTLHSACTAKAYKHSTKTNGEHDFPPPGSMAGADAWGQWMLHKLDVLAVLYLRGTYPDLIHAVQRAIIDHTAERAAPATYMIQGSRSFSANL